MFFKSLFLFAILMNTTLGVTTLSVDNQSISTINDKAADSNVNNPVLSDVELKKNLITKIAQKLNDLAQNDESITYMLFFPSFSGSANELLAKSKAIKSQINQNSNILDTLVYSVLNDSNIAKPDGFAIGSFYNDELQFKANIDYIPGNNVNDNNNLYVGVEDIDPSSANKQPFYLKVDKVFIKTEQKDQQNKWDTKYWFDGKDIYTQANNQTKNQSAIVLNALNYNLNQYSFSELNTNLILKSIAQFNDNQLVNTPLFTMDVDYNSFIKVYQPEIIPYDVSLYNQPPSPNNNNNSANQLLTPYKNIIALDFKVKINNQAYMCPNKIIIYNIAPTLDIELSPQVVNNTIDITRINPTLNLNALKASQFALDFNNNMKKIIFDQSDYSYKPFITSFKGNQDKVNENINNLDINYFLGDVDDIEGIIKNNRIEISIPDVKLNEALNLKIQSDLDRNNIKLLNRNYVYAENLQDLNFEITSNNSISQKIIINFDIQTVKKTIDLQIQDVVNAFDISVYDDLKQTSASSFNEELFKKYLVNYNSSLLTDMYLVSIDASNAYFSQLLKSFIVNTWNDQLGTLTFTIELFDPNDTTKIITKTFDLQGFKKTLNIYQDGIGESAKKHFILNQVWNNATDKKGAILGFLSQNNFKQVQDILNNQALFRFEGIDANQFFNEYIATDSKGSKDITIDSNSISEKLGEFDLVIHLKDQGDLTYNLNDIPIIDDKLIIKFYGFKNDIQIKVVNDYKVCSSKAELENIQLGNLVGFEQSTVSNANITNNQYCIITNLTENEFKNKVVEKITIDKALNYGYAIVNISFNPAYVSQLPISLKLEAPMSNRNQLIMSALTNKNIDASENIKLKNLSVDDINESIVIDLFKFDIAAANNQTTKQTTSAPINNNYVGTFNCSKEIFTTFIFKGCDITKGDTSVKVNVKLNAGNYEFSINNLKQSTKLTTIIAIVVSVSVVVAAILITVIILVRRNYLKKKVLKTNKWDVVDCSDLNDIVGDKNEK